MANAGGSIRTILAWAPFVLLGLGQAAAVPPPQPLEVRLDLASGVVLGQVARVEKIEEPDGRQRTRTTLSVEETLKGEPLKSVESTAYGYERLTVGGRGIWLIDAAGQLVWPHGHLPEAQKAEVQRILKILAERKWSGEVNGIQAWAGVLSPPEDPDGFSLLFVVRNCSKGDVFLPRANCRGDILTASVKRDDGKEFTFPLKSGEPCNVLHCDRLPAGQLHYVASHYVHTKGDRRFPPDAKYQVTLTYRNTRDGELLVAVGMQAPPVDAWKGELSAPPFELALRASAEPPPR
ncbi:MAG: hypothetical protein FJ290_32375 [Planctomycetes bacterium]|nr:hypothetical protein [Planctomycetota bacterium]